MTCFSFAVDPFSATFGIGSTFCLGKHQKPTFVGFSSRIRQRAFLAGIEKKDSAKHALKSFGKAIPG
jgi:hypothetical protein